MVFATYLFVVAPPPVLGAGPGEGKECPPCPGEPGDCIGHCGGSCTPCPDGESGCSPDCTPPCNPTITPVSVGATISTDATNTTIQVTVSPDLSGTTVSIDWGNTTTYAYSPPSVPSNFTVFLNYLEPSTTYYFEATADPPVQSSCTQQYTWNSYSGSWTTGSDNLLAITGVVSDADGARAPGGIVVFAACTVFIASEGSLGSSDPYTWYNYIGTGPDGAFSLNVQNPASDPAENICGEYGFGYIVAAVNGEFCPTSSGCVADDTWAGVWNETIVTYAPQTVDFVLPMNFVGPYIPEVLEFSNAASGYSLITFTKATTFDETQTDYFGLSGGAYVGLGGGFSYETSTTSSTSGSVSRGYSQNGGSLEVLSQFVTSGTVEFNALNRTWTMPQETPCTAACGGEVDTEQGPQYVSSWLYPGSNAPGIYLLDGWKHDNLSAGGLQTGNVTIKGSVVTTSTLSFSLGVGVTLYGVGAVSLGADIGSSTSAAKSYSYDLNWTITVPAGGPETCFEVYGQGGSAAADTATIIGIWAGAPGEDGC
jgi:hypothetical protein